MTVSLPAKKGEQRCNVCGEVVQICQCGKQPAQPAAAPAQPRGMYDPHEPGCPFILCIGECTCERKV